MSYFDFRARKSERKTAAALVYDPVGSDPPQVLAAGEGLLAEEIVRIARDHDIPLHEDAELVAALSRLNCSELIPRELYAVVAEVLAFVYHTDAQARERAGV